MERDFHACPTVSLRQVPERVQCGNLDRKHVQECTPLGCNPFNSSRADGSPGVGSQVNIESRHSRRFAVSQHSMDGGTIRKHLVSAICVGAILSGLLIASVGHAEEPAGKATLEGRSPLQSMKRNVGFLASDTLEGRQAGSRGGQAAAAFLVSEMRRLGLQPAGSTPGDFRQSFGANYQNLLGLLPATNPANSQEILIIGAHYDHVGLGTPQNSFGPFGRIHNGADDNASGVALLLELAETFSQQSDRPRSLLFAFWDAEEAGLLGSWHWTRSPTLDRQRIKFALNLDMVGRMTDSTVHCMGWRSAPGLRPLLANSNQVALRFEFGSTVTDDSDHYPFYAARIPVLHFDTGKHGDYHRPTDDADKLNWDGMTRLRSLTVEILSAMLSAPSLPDFRPECWNEPAVVLNPQPKRLAAPRIGISWVTTPARDGSLIVQQITPGFPAEQIGMRPGDRLHKLHHWQRTGLEDLKTAVATAPTRVTVEWSPSDSESRRTETLELRGTTTTHGLTLRWDPAFPGCPIIDTLTEASWSDRAGLWPGDVLLTIDGRAIADQPEFDAIYRTAVSPLRVRAERRGQPFSVLLLNSAIGQNAGFPVATPQKSRMSNSQGAVSGAVLKK